MTFSLVPSQLRFFFPLFSFSPLLIDQSFNHTQKWLQFSDCFREALSTNALRACVYIYIPQLSSFRALTLWFIDLTVAIYLIQYTFLSLCQFFTRKRTKHDNTRSPPFSYDTKMAAGGYWTRKTLILRELLY